MPPRPHGVARYGFLAAVASCVACGATGLDWVGEAHLESASLQHVNGAPAAPSGPAISGSIPAAEQTDSRPRLNHTVTLGELDAVASQSDGTRGTSAPTVVVNNYNQVNVVTPSMGYGAYGYSLPRGGFSRGYVAPYQSPSATGPLPGQSWPAVADHGPSFPYHAPPATPWTRTQ